MEESGRKRRVHESKKRRIEDQVGSSSVRVLIGVQNIPKFKRNSGNSAS